MNTGIESKMLGIKKLCLFNIKSQIFTKKFFYGGIFVSCHLSVGINWNEPSLLIGKSLFAFSDMIKLVKEILNKQKKNTRNHSYHISLHYFGIFIYVTAVGV